MTIQQTCQIFQNRQKRASLMVITILLFVLATLGIDFLFAQFQDSSFYISESLLFSSYWLLFLPLLHFHWKLVKPTRKTLSGVFITGFATTAHLLGYPALVWLLSKCFYPHTFSYRQTFNYGLTNYFIETLLIYGLSFMIIVFYKNKFSNPPAAIDEKQDSVHSVITSLIVSDSNKKTAIAVHEILYFSASSPYVNIHHQSKKYLYTASLKLLETQLNNNQFVRIHKSYIVNIPKVVSFQSRLNGDYDLTLMDDTELRVSRNYAAVFKARFEAYHRVTTK